METIDIREYEGPIIVKFAGGDPDMPWDSVSFDGLSAYAQSNEALPVGDWDSERQCWEDVEGCPPITITTPEGVPLVVKDA